MRIYKIPSFLFLFFPKILWKDSATEDKVYLTFDDGPDHIFTPKILNILEKKQAIASFFVIGQKAQQYSEIIRQINQLGHTIGVHSFEHKPLFYQPKAYMQDQLRNSKFIVEQIIGKPVRFFRPPYGAFSPRLIRVCQEFDLKPVLWSVMTYDFDEAVSNKFILKLIETKTSGGDIIVFHDGHIKSDRTARIIASIIEIIEEKGLKLNSIHK